MGRSRRKVDAGIKVAEVKVADVMETELEVADVKGVWVLDLNATPAS